MRNVKKREQSVVNKPALKDLKSKLNVQIKGQVWTNDVEQKPMWADFIGFIFPKKRVSFVPKAVMALGCNGGVYKLRKSETVGSILKETNLALLV